MTQQPSNPPTPATQPEQPLTRQHYQDHSSKEVAAGIAWLSLGAVVSVLLEVVYLDTRIGNVSVPISALIAFGFNMVLSRTARLWTTNIFIALIPMFFWIAGYFALLFWVFVDGSVFIPGNIGAALLLFAGIFGSGWPFLHRK